MIHINGFIAICEGNGSNDGKYVAADCDRNCINVSHGSFTPHLQQAKVWGSRELANRETCGNERVETLASQFTNLDGTPTL